MDLIHLWNINGAEVYMHTVPRYGAARPLEMAVGQRPSFLPFGKATVVVRSKMLEACQDMLQKYDGTRRGLAFIWQPLGTWSIV